MSWRFSLALVEAFSAACSLGGEPSALSSGAITPLPCCAPDRTTAALPPSPCGTTSAPSTACRGAALLTWFREASRAKSIAPPPEAITRRKTSGRKCGESWQMSLPGVFGRRTSPSAQSTTRPTTSRRWVIGPRPFDCRRQTWVLTTFGADIGFLHTPTATGNYCAPSMQKWPGCRAFRQVFGRVTPEAHEWLMGWPHGWTALKPLETASFQAWLRSHSSPSPVASKEAA
jgi:hypothetical protein